MSAPLAFDQTSRGAAEMKHDDNYGRQVGAATAWVFLFALLILGAVGSQFKSAPMVAEAATVR